MLTETANLTHYITWGIHASHWFCESHRAETWAKHRAQWLIHSPPPFFLTIFMFIQWIHRNNKIADIYFVLCVDSLITQAKVGLWRGFSLHLNISIQKCFLSNSNIFHLRADRDWSLAETTSFSYSHSRFCFFVFWRYFKRLEEKTKKERSR